MKTKIILLIVLLIIVSPVFGIILADKVGYHEPLDIAAEKLGLSEESSIEYHTPFEDYSFPGLDPITGYILSGFLGVVIILGIGRILRSLVKSSE
ncbi:MAG: cobalamin biosynthesis protein [Desulfurococcales archaeon]|nr:cobalamin biosynthesis protein [Desulfurococcales archaeon]MCE4622026.1 cobalamin biosynthesis protein [Desulfurococcales archaeon]MCE4626108.1 cobalamin biosynthesis protein [Desulfurococcales archaeon]MCE4629988.1 cobalamin biosynthesis protein [Desulfurococcales archaeon]